MLKHANSREVVEELAGDYAGYVLVLVHVNMKMKRLLLERMQLHKPH